MQTESVAAALACTDGLRFTHEPRALWTVASQQAAADAAELDDARVRVNKDHFRNTTKYPMVLTHALVCAINYTYRSYAVETVDDLTDVQNSMAAQNLVEVFISAPYSLHYTARSALMALTPARPQAQPSLRYSLASPFASSPFGISRWAFDKTLVLPPKVACELDLSCMNVPTQLTATYPSVRGTIAFDEASSGIFGGNNRMTDQPGVPVAGGGFSLLWGRQLANLPFGADPFGFVAAQQDFTDQLWPVQLKFPANDYHRQETNRGQTHNFLTGFGVHIDQIAADVVLNGAAAPTGGNQVAPFATKIGTRARTRNGGSGEWWWRPGAPLALVTPTMTPAMVHRLPEQITLNPGEELDVELQFPVGPTIEGTLYRPTYTVGVSFTGYAVIEG